VQGESREDLSPRDRARGVSSLERRCGDSALGSWYSEVFPPFITGCRDLIVKEAGAGAVEGLILAGSFATREGSVVRIGGRQVFLSDVDLLLVVSSPEAHARIYPGRSGIGKACEASLPGAEFEGRVDIGVMTRGELVSMPLSPGVFDMREMGLILYGTPEIFSSLPSFTRDAIGSREALRLLENRMAAFLGERPVHERPEGVALYRFLYGVSKVYTDIVTASLCASRCYRPGYMARVEFLASPEGSGASKGLGRSLIDDAVRWTQFKVDPDSSAVWTSRDRAPHMWLDAAGDLLAAWDSIRLGEEKDGGRARTRLIDLARSWRGIDPGRAWTGRAMMVAGALLAGREPMEQIREESVRLIRHAAERGTGDDVGAAPGGWPHGRGSWDDAASRTSAQWRRLVTGRGDDSDG
jgi:hypothetical protein